MNKKRKSEINATVEELNHLKEKLSEQLSNVKTIKCDEIKQYSAYLSDKNKSDEEVDNIDAAVNNLYSAEEYVAASIDSITEAIFYLETASEY